MSAPARPAAAPVFGDFNGSNTVTVSVTVVAGANVTVFVGCCPAGTVASRTVSSMTLPGGTAAQVTGSRVTSTDGTFTSGEWWRITAPTSGTHNLVVTLSGSSRGGVQVCQDIADTGIGQANGAIDSVVALNGSSTPLDNSMIRFGCVFQPNGLPNALVPTQARTVPDRVCRVGVRLDARRRHLVYARVS